MPAPLNAVSMRLTRAASAIPVIFVMVSTFILSNCASRARDVTAVEADERARREIQAWSKWALEPSGLAHPQIPRGAQTQVRETTFVTVSYVRPEDAEWNTWPDGNLRLFNNRMGHMFEVQTNLPQEARLSVERTQLELNRPDYLLAVAEAPDRFLDPLINFALMQERSSVDAGLVARLRGAGAFRASWLTYQGDEWNGLVGFPVVGRASPQPAAISPELHIVAMRLTVAFEVDNAVQEWVFVLD